MFSIWTVRWEATSCCLGSSIYDTVLTQLEERKKTNVSSYHHNNNKAQYCFQLKYHRGKFSLKSLSKSQVNTLVTYLKPKTIWEMKTLRCKKLGVIVIEFNTGGSPVRCPGLWLFRKCSWLSVRLPNASPRRCKGSPPDGQSSQKELGCTENNTLGNQAIYT